MRNRIVRLVTTCATVAALGVASLLPATARDRMSPLLRLEMSRAVFLEGMQQDDPVLIIAAAKLRHSVQMTRADRAPQGSDAMAGGLMSAHNMLSVAADLAQGDATLVALVASARDALQVVTQKGLSQGPAFSSAAIAAKKVDKYPGLTFVGGDFAEVYVEGHGQANLDLYVYDGQGRLVCSDTDVSDFAHCGWYPDTTASFTVQVINKGNGTQYSLVTN